MVHLGVAELSEKIPEWKLSQRGSKAKQSKARRPKKIFDCKWKEYFGQTITYKLLFGPFWYGWDWVGLDLWAELC